MNASLTLVLPVYNAQDRLVDQVERLLDLLPDMTRNFEIVIVDDGSTDDTADIAEELSLFFPQVSLVRHSLRLGLNEAIESGLNASVGEMVVVGDERFGIRVEDLLQLWQIHSRGDQAAARRMDDPMAGVTWLSRVLARSSRRPAAAARPLVQMVRHRGINEADGASPAIKRRVDASIGSAPAAAPRPTRRGALDRMKGFAWGE